MIKMNKLTKDPIPGSVVIIKVSIQQRSRCSSQGVMGIVFKKKHNRVKIISEYGIIGGGIPLKSLYFQEHEWNIKNIPTNMLPSKLKYYHDRIVTDVFDEKKHNIVSLKYAQKKCLVMITQELHDVSVKICALKVDVPVKLTIVFVVLDVAVVENVNIQMS